MTGLAGPDGAEEFAALLRDLKDRSGLSYGALAKRLHTSTSTLHRYCNGTVLPSEYPPVERLARACRATPQELVELHRRWVLADAVRASQAAGTRVGGTAAAAWPDLAPAPAFPVSVPAPEREQVSSAPVPAGDSGSAAVPAPETEPAGPAGAPGPAGGGRPEEPSASDEPGAGDIGRGPARPRRRTALIACAAVAAVAAAVALVQQRTPGGGGGGVDQPAAHATAIGSRTPGAGQPPALSSPRVNGGGQPAPSAPSATGTATTVGAGAPQRGRGQGVAAGPAGGTGAAVPLTVGVRPYVYADPCSQHFLVDSEPAQVGPPASEQNAPRWAAAYGAVPSDEQEVALTVQGTGAQTVVLQALHVRVVTRHAPLAWNDYSMGVGCGGGVPTRSFDIDLDAGSATVTVKNGQRDFPYKVSASDPEVFYVVAHTKAHDVRWDLALDWSSGGRHGTVHIDDDGVPFRTSADVARPGYDYPLGTSDWIRREQ